MKALLVLPLLPALRIPKQRGGGGHRLQGVRKTRSALIGGTDAKSGKTPQTEQVKEILQTKKKAKNSG